MTIPHVPFPLTRWDGKRTYKPVVYFIMAEGAVAYIGSTNMLSERMHEYGRRDHDRKNVWFFETNTRGEAYDCEYWLIETIQPPLNRLRASRRYSGAPLPPFFTYHQNSRAA